MITTTTTFSRRSITSHFAAILNMQSVRYHRKKKIAHTRTSPTNNQNPTFSAFSRFIDTGLAG